MNFQSKSSHMKNLIKDYQERYDQLQMVNHTILQACIHPQKLDVIIALERVIFPTTNDAGEPFSLFTNNVGETEKGLQQKKLKKSKPASKGRKKTEDLIDIRQEPNIYANMNDRETKGRDIDAEDGPDQDKERFEAEEEGKETYGIGDEVSASITFQAHKCSLDDEDEIEEKCIYLISFWSVSLNGKILNQLEDLMIELEEVPFNNQFYISQDKMFIYYFNFSEDHKFNLKMIFLCEERSYTDSEEIDMPSLSIPQDSGLWNNKQYFYIHLNELHKIYKLRGYEPKLKLTILAFQNVKETTESYKVMKICINDKSNKVVIILWVQTKENHGIEAYVVDLKSITAEVKQDPWNRQDLQELSQTSFHYLFEMNCPERINDYCIRLSHSKIHYNYGVTELIFVNSNSYKILPLVQEKLDNLKDEVKMEYGRLQLPQFPYLNNKIIYIFQDKDGCFEVNLNMDQNDYSEKPQYSIPSEEGKEQNQEIENFKKVKFQDLQPASTGKFDFQLQDDQRLLVIGKSQNISQAFTINYITYNYDPVPKDIVKNDKGRFVMMGSSGKYYCGDDLEGDCSGCIGCGLHNGCNCLSCMKLDIQRRRLQKGGYVNKEGRVCKKDDSGNFFCGKFDSERGKKEYCGLKQDNYCSDCIHMTDSFESRYKDIEWPAPVVEETQYGIKPFRVEVCHLKQTSEIQFLYPYFIYCISGKNMYIQSIFNPQRIDNIILDKKYDSFQEKTDFFIYESIEKISMKDVTLQEVVQGALVQASIKKEKDYVIVLQYRKSIDIFPFKAKGLYQRITDGYFKMQMLTYFSVDQKILDRIFYIGKNKQEKIYSIMSLSFEEGNKTVSQKKSVQQLTVKKRIIMFTRNEDYLYIMDNSFIIREFRILNENDVQQKRTIHISLDHGLTNELLKSKSKMDYIGNVLYKQKYGIYCSEAIITTNQKFKDEIELIKDDIIDGPFKLPNLKKIGFLVKKSKLNIIQKKKVTNPAPAFQLEGGSSEDEESQDIQKKSQDQNQNQEYTVEVDDSHALIMKSIAQVLPPERRDISTPNEESKRSLLQSQNTLRRQVTGRSQKSNKVQVQEEIKQSENEKSKQSLKSKQSQKTMNNEGSIKDQQAKDDELKSKKSNSIKEVEQEVIPDLNETKTHQNHEHPLKLVSFKQRVASNYAYTGGYICNECRSSSKIFSYSCLDCNYDICQACNVATVIHRKSHSIHDHVISKATMEIRIQNGYYTGGYYCDMCRGCSGDKSFSCLQCGFDLCIECEKKYRIETFKLLNYSQVSDEVSQGHSSNHNSDDEGSSSNAEDNESQKTRNNLANNSDDESENFRRKGTNRSIITESESILHSTNNYAQVFNLTSYKSKLEQEYLQESTFFLLIPYIDSNEISLNFRTSGQEKDNKYPPVEFSTLLNDQEILTKISSQYLVFNVSGKFLYRMTMQVDPDHIEDEHKLLQLSDDRQTFLFVNIKKENKEEGGQKLFEAVPKKEDKYTNFSVFKINKKELQLKGIIPINNKNDRLTLNKATYFSQIKLSDQGDIYYAWVEPEFLWINNEPTQRFYVRIFKNRKEQFEFQELITNYIQNKFYFDHKQNYKIEIMFFKDAFVFMVKNQVHCSMVDNYTELKQVKEGSVPYKVNLDIRKGDFIERILITSYLDNELKQTMIQIVISNLKKERNKSLLICNWDLKLNVEHSFIELDKSYNITKHCIIKGINGSFNYLANNMGLYDLQYCYPLTILKDGYYSRKNKISLGINETKITSNLQHYLGVALGQMDFIQTSYNMLDLVYQSRLDLESSDNILPQDIQLQHFFPQFGDFTAFHFDFQKKFILQLIYDKTIQSEVRSLKFLFFLLIHEDPKNRTPFELAKKRPQCMEIILKMLITVKEYMTYKSILEKHCKELSDMGLVLFQEYLEICTFRTFSMKQFKDKELIKRQDVIIEHEGSNLGYSFEKKLKKYVKADDDKTSLGYKVQIYALEIDWILKKIDKQHPDENYLDFLATTDNDDIFSLQIIETMITYVWAVYYNQIFNKILIPYLIYMALVIFYVTYICDQYKKGVQPLNRWEIADYSAWIISLCFYAYHLYQEIRQLINSRLEYFFNVWNIINFLSLGLNLAFILGDILHLDTNQLRGIGSIVVMFMWLQLFYFFRLFKQTAPLVRMIQEVMKDMQAFAFVVFLSFCAFGNAFYILSQTVGDVEDSSGNTVPFKEADDGTQDLFYFSNIAKAVIYSFRLGLGDFHTDAFQFAPATGWLWVLYIAEAVMVQVILLNLLISIMSDTYQRVSQLGNRSKLKEWCQIMAECKFLINRDRIFQTSKYLIILKPEKAEQSSIKAWEGLISKMKADVKDIIKDRDEKLEEQLHAFTSRIESLVKHKQAK